jgi:hypothetical protein
MGSPMPSFNRTSPPSIGQAAQVYVPPCMRRLGHAVGRDSSDTPSSRCKGLQLQLVTTRQRVGLRSPMHCQEPRSTSHISFIIFLMSLPSRIHASHRKPAVQAFSDQHLTTLAFSQRTPWGAASMPRRVRPLPLAAGHDRPTGGLAATMASGPRPVDGRSARRRRARG